MSPVTAPLRVAWFSPLPPAGSGIAAYSAEVLPQLGRDFEVDTFEPRNAHEFAWRHQRAPYALTVYQLGNAAWHDYMWAYAAGYPGLVVLHDARLHHARARHLLSHGRFDDYRSEFRYDHPGARPDFAEYAVEGLGGPIYYFWRMIAAIARTARGVAVHNERVADDLRAEFPGTRIDAIRMGVPAIDVDAAAAADTRRQLGVPADAIVFAAFGKVTPEKRIAAAVRALAALREAEPSACLLLIGDPSGYESLRDEIAAAGVADRVIVAGEIADADLPRFLGAADVCLCLRWPTAEETSASWLRCLAAGRATVISDLPHLVDVPSLVARGWHAPSRSADPVTVSVDLLDEETTLREAMRRLAGDAGLRGAIAAAGCAWWRAHHRLELMADDYRALIRDVACRPVPRVDDLPPHFTDDYSSRARAIAGHFGVDIDILRP